MKATGVTFDFRGKRQEGELLEENEATVRVRVRLGGETFDIKRHKVKHDVVIEE